MYVLVRRVLRRPHAVQCVSFAASQARITYICIGNTRVIRPGMAGLFLFAFAAVAHSVDFWVYTDCVVPDYKTCSHMVAIPAEDDNVLMCCQNIVPHYLADLSKCRPSVALWPNGGCPTIVTANNKDTGWCCMGELGQQAHRFITSS